MKQSLIYNRERITEVYGKSNLDISLYTIEITEDDEVQTVNNVPRSLIPENLVDTFNARTEHICLFKRIRGFSDHYSPQVSTPSTSPVSQQLSTCEPGEIDDDDGDEDEYLEKSQVVVPAQASSQNIRDNRYER